MAWTTPRTWTPGETVTAAVYNEHIRDEMVFLNNNYATLGEAPFGNSCMLSRNASWTLSTAIWTNVPNDTVIHDPDGWQTSTPDTYGIKVPAAGRYYVSMGCMFYDVSHTKRMRFIINGTTAIHEKVRNAGDNWARTSHRFVVELAANDYCHVQYYQASGSNQSVVGLSSSNSANHFGITRLV